VPENVVLDPISGTLLPPSLRLISTRMYVCLCAGKELYQEVIVESFDHEWPFQRRKHRYQTIALRKVN
jgi:hypothetical protein